MARWMTSDLHFGHRLVAGLRGFGDDTAAHDDAVVANWNAVVRDDDIGYILGDVTLRRAALIWPLTDRMRGRKILIAGNHDAVHPVHRDSWRHYREWEAHFEAVLPFLRIRVAGRDVLLSHFPYDGDHGADRYVQYRLRDSGMPLFHGHTHGKEQITYSRAGTVQIHAGLDARDLRPLNADTTGAAELVIALAVAGQGAGEGKENDDVTA